MTFDDADHAAMAEALRLARRGLYTTAPNPRVGCVLVRDGEIVGRGWHRRAGEAHAEVLALEEAGERARGATAYVTLEPCSHHGRTPPCTDALIRAGVARVVVPGIDPNARVAGQGLERLQAAGVETATGLLEELARALNPGHFQRFGKGRPWLRLKMAISVDGRTAMASGESRWISCAASRRDVQLWRARSCALLTGIGTVLHDDPRLDLRAADLPLDDAEAVARRQPLRIVLDPRGRLPAAARLLVGAPVLLFRAEGATAPAPAAAEVVTVAAAAEGLDLGAVLAELARRELNEVQVEAGPRLAGAWLRSGFVDELLVYQAPVLLGDRARALATLPFDRLAECIELELLELRRIGTDLRLRYRPRRRRSGAAAAS